ncbi:hypothetical protein HNQ93_003828 [Hymenobacter luteus]|uniref:Fibronectin type-III domain-containing protein n=2 Tax=Hymenobacter TaxID=89966 RepID=A0A7W9WER0_9BACT|nr:MULTISPECIES: hypothetical protein [Hymenobacter]MBB4603089.1 hypothetical protein [Hymenobacter latericoloratus]MBB6060952.1 hypothetical protein [Hymenobacter luteus]
MPIPTPLPDLQLHLVPAGRRLEFTTKAGCFAFVYRRCQQEDWQCVACNARSPFLDMAVLPPGAAPQYVVRYHNAAGAPLGATAMVQSHPVAMPVRTSWINL